MSVNAPVRNGQLVDHVGSAIHHGTESLEVIPKLLRQLLETGAWRKFRTKLGEDVEHERFAEFVVTPPLKGLGTTVEFVRQLVAKDPTALGLLDQASDNIRHRQGTSREAALRRLRKDRPDLHAKVLAKELTPHRAMVEAGFRHPTVTVPTDNPERLAATLRRHLKPRDLAVLAKLLGDDG